MVAKIVRKILKRSKSGIKLYFDNSLFEASNNYDCSFPFNCKLKFSPILEETLSRATNFHSGASAIDGSRVSKAKMSKMLEDRGDRSGKQDRPFKDIVETAFGELRGRGEEGMGRFSVFVDPRVFVGDFHLLKRWTHSSLAYLFENRHLEIEWCRSEG